MNDSIVPCTHLSSNALADRWRISAKTLANQRSAGTGLPYVKVGGRVLYRLSDIAVYEEAQTVYPVAA